MRKLFFPLFIIYFLPANSQSKSDLGLITGVSYYMGDINPKIPFYSPNLSAGATYRYNMNTRYVIKGELNYCILSANDKNFTDPYQQDRGASFSSKLYDFALQFEFNFLPIKFVERKVYFSPFVSSGVGASFIMNSASYNKTIGFVLPAAIGIRFALGKKWSTGVQWNFRNTFRDNLDAGIANGIPNKGVVNPIAPGYGSAINNNDWYMFAGFFLTYKVFDFGDQCPAYQKELK
jgi:hypothetical protein